jgi:hypothetical protein
MVRVDLLDEIEHLRGPRDTTALEEDPRSEDERLGVVGHGLRDLAEPLERQRQRSQVEQDARFHEERLDRVVAPFHPALHHRDDAAVVPRALEVSEDPPEERRIGGAAAAGTRTR